MSAIEIIRMKFQRSTPNETYPIIRFVSLENRWELGFCPMMFGIRVCLSQVNSPLITLTYCAGPNEGFALLLLATIATILQPYPETVTERQLQDDFPRYSIKPINLDPVCWPRLMEMSEAVGAKTT